jgi:methionyl-tRNA formyltransferase
MPARIVFMGTPDFAVPSLEALLAAQSAGADWQVVGVITQPDRPSGRGKQLTPPPVKLAAHAAGVPVLQPEKLRGEAVDALAALAPEVIIVAAFGQILRKSVLNLPPHGCINGHASLLPRWRGAAPIAAAIYAGDAETGVTIMQMDPGLDTGPMLAKRAMPISPTHTTGQLTAELAQLGAALLVDTLPEWLAGRLPPEPQAETLATLAPRLQKEAGELNWADPAAVIERQVRAFSPWPGTFTTGPRGQLNVLAVAVAGPEVPVSLPPGAVFKHHKEVYVAAGSGAVRLITVQPPGKKPMDALSLLNGQPEWGGQLGT